MSERAGGDALKSSARRQNTSTTWEKLWEEKGRSVSSVYFVKHTWMFKTSFVVWLVWFVDENVNCEAKWVFHIKWYMSSVWNVPLPPCGVIDDPSSVWPKVEPRFNRSAAEVAPWRASYFHSFPLDFLHIFSQRCRSYLIVSSQYLWAIQQNEVVNLFCWHNWVSLGRAKWL